MPFELLTPQDAAILLMGTAVTAANVKETAKVQKVILQDCLEGHNGRQGFANWISKWLRFDRQENIATVAQNSTTAKNRTVEAESAVLDEIKSTASDDVAPDATDAQEETDTATKVALAT